MKKQLLLLLIGFLSLNSYSQITFEKGYYINNSDEKINCLIKNVDWKNNPTQFGYRLSENDEIKKATIHEVKEFGIDNTSKYIRNTVNIDRSSENIKKLSSSRNPIFNKEELFLKVLIEGKANLYLYEDGNLIRFFYKKESSDIEQLVYKSYEISGLRIRKNNGFRQQLLNNLKCHSISVNDLKNMDYKKNELVNFFVKYNECSDSELVNFEEKNERDLFNLSLRPRLNSSSLAIHNSVHNTIDTDFENEFGFGFGIETEFIMPFNQNKWAIIIEATYQRFKSEKKLAIQNVSANYKSIELPIGIRHYFFLNNTSKIFINGSFIFDFVSDSEIVFDLGSDLEITRSSNLGFGMGYKQGDKYSFELRYQTSREVLKRYVSWYSDYSTVSIIFGYSIF